MLNINNKMHSLQASRRVYRNNDSNYSNMLTKPINPQTSFWLYLAVGALLLSQDCQVVQWGGLQWRAEERAPPHFPGRLAQHLLWKPSVLKPTHLHPVFPSHSSLWVISLGCCAPARTAYPMVYPWFSASNSSFSARCMWPSSA